VVDASFAHHCTTTAPALPRTSCLRGLPILGTKPSFVRLTATPSQA
jgi:hypothetical protein